MELVRQVVLAWLYGCSCLNLGENVQNVLPVWSRSPWPWLCCSPFYRRAVIKQNPPLAGQHPEAQTLSALFCGHWTGLIQKPKTQLGSTAVRSLTLTLNHSRGLIWATLTRSVRCADLWFGEVRLQLCASEYFLRCSALVLQALTNKFTYIILKD